VHLVVVCDVRRKSRPQVDARSLREVRRAELQQAADFLGASSVTCLEHVDAR